MTQESSATLPAKAIGDACAAVSESISNERNAEREKLLAERKKARPWYVRWFCYDARPDMVWAETVIEQIRADEAEVSSDLGYLALAAKELGDDFTVVVSADDFYYIRDAYFKKGEYAETEE